MARRQKLSICGRYWLPAEEVAYRNKADERQDIQKDVEDFLARGGSIDKLSHSGQSQDPNTEAEYRDMFKQNLSFGHKRNRKIQFNHKLRYK